MRQILRRCPGLAVLALLLAGGSLSVSAQAAQASRGFQQAPAAASAFTSSNLPVVVIDTDGQDIRDEPKITAHMGVIFNGEGARNDLTDPFNAYDGWIGIEVRGSSSQDLFPKKSYAVETRDEAGQNRNVALLDLPAENDWVLYAPYSDKSLLRNVLAYHIARRLGRYASRTRFCELVLNGQYQGIYVLMEKIKRDKNRVDIATLGPGEVSGDDLSGGYIVKIDKIEGSEVEGWYSPYPPRPGAAQRVYYQYHYPDAADLAPEQRTYIQQVVDTFETVMAGPAWADTVSGYARYLAVDSFVDYFIVNEAGRNVDGYRLSAFLYKDKDSKGGKLVMGPVWDFNLAFGNADYYNGAATAGLQVDFAVSSDAFQLPFWWKKLAEDRAFAQAVLARWEALRGNELHTDTLTQQIDAWAALLGEAQVRNFERWPVLGSYVWPNAYVGRTYDDEVRYLKRWLAERMAWLDANLPRLATLPGETDGPLPGGFRLQAAYPNPFDQETTVTLEVGSTQYVIVVVVDVLGRRVASLYDGLLQPGTPLALRFPAGTLPDGLYFVRAEGDFFSATRRVVLLR